MVSFAIIRQDGEIDKAEGASILDVSTRYGWPGNGEIVVWNDDAHMSALRHEFATTDDQTAALADKPKAGK